MELCIVRRLRAVYPSASVILIEKEPSCGLHASGRDIGVLQVGFEFRRLAVEEVKKYSRRHMVSLASELVEGVKLERYTSWEKSGIRGRGR